MASIRDNKWMVLNGRAMGDAQGEFTYEARGAKSTVDYVIITEGGEADMSVLSDTTVIGDGHAMIRVE